VRPPAKRGGRFFAQHIGRRSESPCAWSCLLAAGLLLRGLYYAQTVDPVFEMKDVAAAFLFPKAQGYDENRSTAFMGRLRERVAALSGVIEMRKPSARR